MLKGPTAVSFQRLPRDGMDEAARVHRAAFDDRLPWLAGLHTPEEDRSYFRNQVFAQCDVWGAIDSGLIGFVAFRQGWIDQLYVLPPRQGRGVGDTLLNIAKDASSELQLWTFQRNAPARRFYEKRGFTVMEKSDGSRNEECEPDVLYRWTRAAC